MSRISNNFFNRIHTAYTEAKDATQNSSIQKSKHPHFSKIQTFFKTFHNSLSNKTQSTQAKTCTQVQCPTGNTTEDFDFELLAKLKKPELEQIVNKKINLINEKLNSSPDADPKLYDQLNILKNYLDSEYRFF